MYTDVLQLEDELDEFLHDFGYQVVDLQTAGRGSGRLVRLFLERVDGEPLTIDDCSAATPQIRLFLEARGLFDDNTRLEVSSGGLDRILKRDRDFERFLGSEVKIAWFEGAARQTMTGRLASFTDDWLVVTTAGDGEPVSHRIERSALARANLVPQVEL